MIRPSSFLGKSLAIVLTVAVPTMGMPLQVFFPEKRVSFTRKEAAKPAPVESRALMAKEMRSLTGRLDRNPYISGSQKYSVSYKGVDLLTGDFSMSATDLSFEGGYGIPVNVTRSYSANNADEGPLGLGWTLSVDIRSTAGGILKSSGAPVRGVPVNFKERPTGQVDPNIVYANGDGPGQPSVGQPVEAIISTDASGEEETQQRDVDGIISPPPYDKNQNDAEYETVTTSGGVYQILTRNVVTTPEGTKYVYEKHGTYNGGMTTFDGVATDEPSNVLKIETATDRHGNVTTYNYASTGPVTFLKANGTTTEDRLLSIEMPNGHEITFTWGNGTTTPANRIVSAKDNGNVRTVSYAYDSYGKLTSVTTPGGMTTSYAYHLAAYRLTGPATWERNGPSDLITKITDPRGLETVIDYIVDEPTGSQLFNQKGVKAYKIVFPNGTETHFVQSSSETPTQQLDEYPGGQFLDYITGQSNPYYQGYIGVGVDHEAHEFTVGTYELRSSLAPDQPVWIKAYDTRTMDLVREESYTFPRNTELDDDRLLTSSDNDKRTIVTTSSNFMGNPLTKTVTEQTKSGSTWASPTTSRVATVDYAYWGEDKYFQQKAVKDQGGRISFTDYFDNTATTGKKGQTYRVYSSAFSSFSNTTGSTWKYNIVPTSSTTHAAEFDYDTKGRPVDVWKLQKTSPSWSYVQTHTTYGSDTDGSWGQASSVVEDYGSGKINRTTQTLHYTSWGFADQVEDAAGRVFETDYDLDGKI